VAARLASGANRRVVRCVWVGALWLAVLCPFTANYTSAILTETLATFLTTLAVLIFLLPPAMEMEFLHEKRQVVLGALVRPEAPLLIAGVLLVLWVRWHHRANWRKLAVATLWMLAGLLLPLAPWAARNARTFGRVQFLAPRYAETFGDYIPTGFYAWTGLDVSLSRCLSFRVEICPLSLFRLTIFLPTDSTLETNCCALLRCLKNTIVGTG
jgi:hypothetical protein